jgi:subtilisin family serine protease
VKRSTTALLVLVAGAALALPVARTQAQGAAPLDSRQTLSDKIPVKSVADLPVHEYAIEGKASEMLTSDGFLAFATQVKTNLLGDLDKYDIQDKTTLQGYYSSLMQIAALEGKYEEVPGLIAKQRELEGKESKRLMLGQVMIAYVAAEKASAGDPEKFTQVFRQALSSNVGKLPWDKVAEEVKSAYGRSKLLSRELILGQVQASIDPFVEKNKGKLSGELVQPMIGMRVMLDKFLPVQPLVGEVYGALIEKNKVERKDVWSPTLATLTQSDNLTPVVVAIWDSGVDTSIFSGNLFTNAKETVNGKDDDANGYVDDVHGIAYDLWDNPVPELLHPITELKSDVALVMGHTKGLSDNSSNVDSPERDAFLKHMSGMKAAEVGPFLEDLGLYGNYSHGTHVAGIAAEGNPFAKIMPVRITFDFKEIPQVTPSVEQARKTAKAYKDTVAYMRAHGVRVVNMSWGGSVKSVEAELEKKGVGANAEERKALAKEIFGIGKQALEEAMRSAPEILFVAAAGNSDNDNEFAEFIPSGLNVPNMLTVGAIDTSAKPTSFTTFGKNVTLYANGFEVDSYVPGGTRMKFNGTSMAAPQATNLAAKIVAINPKLTTQQIVELMRQGAEPMVGYEGRFVINPKRTVSLLKSAK